MIGHEGVLRAVRQLLVQYGPETARIVERWQGLPEGTIEVPPPERIHTAWTDVTKGEFPTWMVIPADTPARRTGQFSDDYRVADETTWQYPIVIATHVAGADEFTCQLHRTRLLLVVRTLLIQAKQIYKSDRDETLTVWLNEYQELVGGAAQNQETHRYLMDAFSLFEVSSRELTPAPQAPLGVVEGVRHDNDVHLMAD